MEFDEAVAESVQCEDLEDRFDQKAAFRAVRRLLGRMPEAKRTLVCSYFLDGLQLEEIGARRGRSKSWMCRLLAQALRELREELARTIPELTGPERRAA